MSKPKLDEKTFLVATFGNLHAQEKALSRLEAVGNIEFSAVDYWTVVVKLKEKDDRQLREEVENIIETSKGYVEKDLAKLKRKKSGTPSPLDYPIFG